ncbi:hypothetical protein BaRGS_00014503 [Batillaria attramentaria]|uniref:PARP catalytic domain-containing protein n=1 Tax=Batillaria attramentaria TaxID=370345 RepID=A0ABD0JBM3_9CAEN
MMVSRTKKKKTAAERELYYCPASKGEDINFIVQHGIRCEPNLKRDTTLGKGGYFYANAGRADKFSGGRRLLFVADCLVGKLGQGDPHLVLPPPLDSRNPSAADLCDCCVDDLSNPKVFVIFNKAQVYAKYAVTFEYV